MKQYLWVLLLLQSSLQMAMDRKRKLLKPSVIKNVIDIATTENEDYKLSHVIGPVPEEISLLLYAYKNYNRLRDLRYPIPANVLLFGAPGTGKSYLVKEFARQFKAHLHQFPVFESDNIEKKLNENCADIEHILDSKEPNSLSIIHCQHAHNLLKPQTVEPVFSIIGHHATTVFEKQGIPTLFIAEQREHPDYEIIRYFNQVIKMPTLEWQQQKEVLSYYIKSQVINWKEIDPCRLKGMNVAQLEQVADEAILRAHYSKHKAVTTADLNDALGHWDKLYKNSKSDGCVPYPNFYS